MQGILRSSYNLKTKDDREMCNNGTFKLALKA